MPLSCGVRWHSFFELKLRMTIIFRRFEKMGNLLAKIIESKSVVATIGGIIGGYVVLFFLTAKENVIIPGGIGLEIWPIYPAVASGLIVFIIFELIKRVK